MSVYHVLWLDLTVVLTYLTICISSILDLDLVLQKSPFLLQEMVNCVGQLIAMAKAGRSKSNFHF